MSGDAKAKVLKVTVNGKNYVHIKFYTSYENETYAEVGCTLLVSFKFINNAFLLFQFIAEDPVRTFRLA
jgi:hypothetical protein